MWRPVLAVLWCAALIAQAAEPAFPQRQVTVIVPFSPGTGQDILARVLGRKLADRWGTGVVVDNRSGASGSIGAELTARAPGDGHTLMMTGTTFAIYAALSKNARYDAVNGFRPVCLVATNALVFVVSSGMPTKTLREFTALARARPGEINYASPGNGTPHHMAMELFKLNAGVNIVHVPHKNTAAATQEVAGGHVGAMILPVHTAAPLVRSGKLRVLAVLGESRTPVFADAPTLKEAGVPRVDARVWFGLMAPPTTPRELVSRINADVNAALKLPDVIESLNAQGLAIAGGEPERFAALVKDELARWSRVITEAKIRTD